MDKILIKKNLLDADLQKYLQIASTTVIIAFTYLIGISIAYLSNQIDFNNIVSMGSALLLTAIIIIPSYLLFRHSIKKIKEITKSIKNLEFEL